MAGEPCCLEVPPCPRLPAPELPLPAAPLVCARCWVCINRQLGGCNPQVEALDRFHNRCTKGSCEGGMPTPTVSIEGSPELEYDPKDWEGAWSSTQAGGEVYSFQITVGGPVGSLQLVVGDRAGEGGASLLAGPPLAAD